MSARFAVVNAGSELENLNSNRRTLGQLPGAVDPRRPAVWDHDGQWHNFGALVHAITNRADQLSSSVAGEPPPATIALVQPGGLSFIVDLFAIWRIGAAAAPVNPRLTHNERATQITLAGATHVLHDDGLAPVHHDRAQSGDDLALVLTTSGTTGTPKPVTLHHANVLAGIDTVLRALRGGSAADTPDTVRPPVPNLVPVPLSLWAGIYQVLFAFRAGNPVVILDPFTTTGFAESVQRHGIKSTVLAPAMMAALNDDTAITSLAPLRFIRSITSPLSVSQAERFHQRFGVTVLNSYGQTELGGEVIGWTAADTRAHGVAKLGSVGRPHPGVSAYVDDETGELCVRAPSMIDAATDAALAARLTPDGHLRTGDIGRIDADGFVWLEGRVTDLINRGGLKVWPDDVEEVVRRHPAVADCAVVGVADDRLGQVPWAFVVPAPNPATAPTSSSAPENAVRLPLDEAALASHCRASLAAYKVPVRFVAVPALPRNDVGKVLRRELVPLDPTIRPDDPTRRSIRSTPA